MKPTHPLPHRQRQSCAMPQARAWLLPLDAWRPLWPRLAPLVSGAQRQRFATIRDAGRRHDRLLAAALHRRVLSQALDMPPEHLPLYRSHTGQPRLAVPGLHTSLAHCAGWVAIALGEGGPVGVDVEPRDTASLRPVADLVCTSREAEAMQRAGADFDARLLELWVRKEAVLKALGLGLARPMASFQAPVGVPLRLRDAQGARLALAVHAHADAGECVAALALPARATHQWMLETP